MTSLNAGQTNLVDGRTRMADWGGKHPNDGWDIGAYEYFPGKWIGVPLLFYPDGNIRALPNSVTTLRVENDTSYTNDVKYQIRKKLDRIAAYAQTLPEEPTFSKLRDIITNDFSAKVFFDPSNRLYGFYYAGTLLGTNIHIADYCFTSGVKSNEYVKVIYPNLTLSTNFNPMANWFSTNELTSLQAMWNDNLLKVVMDTNMHKWVVSDYESPFYYYATYAWLKNFTTNGYTTNQLDTLAKESQARLNTLQGTDQDVKMVNDVVNYVFQGSVSNTNILNNIVVHYERRYWKSIVDDGNVIYNNILTEIVRRLNL